MHCSEPIVRRTFRVKSNAHEAFEHAILGDGVGLPGECCHMERCGSKGKHKSAQNHNSFPPPRMAKHEINYQYARLLREEKEFRLGKATAPTKYEHPEDEQ